MGDLETAIERLYAVFAHHRVGQVTGCPCCVTPEEEARLHARPLRELTGDDLGRYAFKALTTWGTLGDFKHFLPRILELHARGDLGMDLQTLYGKLAYDGPWLDVENDALVGYTRGLFLEAIGSKCTDRIETILESAGVAEMSVPDLLTAGFAPSHEPLDAVRASALAGLVASQVQAISSGVPAWIWWKGPDARDVERWLLAGDAHRRLTSALKAFPDHPDAGEWAAACDVLESIGGARPAT